MNNPIQGQNTFVGMGTQHSNDTPDIPLGLGMALSQDVDAMGYFGNLSLEQKKQVISYVQGSTTGQQAQQRIRHAVEMIKQQDIGKLQP